MARPLRGWGGVRTWPWFNGFVQNSPPVTITMKSTVASIGIKKYINAYSKLFLNCSRRFRCVLMKIGYQPLEFLNRIRTDRIRFRFLRAVPESETGQFEYGSGTRIGKKK